MKNPKTVPFSTSRFYRNARTSGVSEVIGAMLLIAVVVALVAIISVYFNSQTPASEIPNVNFMVGMNRQNPPVLYLTHNGGNSLTSGTFSVYVDGTPQSYSVSDGGTEWSTGKSLIVRLPAGSSPQRVSLVYNTSGSGSIVLNTVSANLSSSADVKIPPYVFTSPTSTPSQETYTPVTNDIANITNSSNFIPAIQQNLTRGSISFWKTNFAKGTGTSGLSCDGVCYSDKLKHNFTFRVTDTTSSSSLSYGSLTSPTKISLNNGDVVTISMSGTSINYVTVFGIAPQIWEFAAKPAYVYIVFANGSTLSTAKNIELVHTYVGSYSNLDSTLVLEVWQNSVAVLTVNGTPRISGVDNRDVMLTNVRPLPIGLYVIQCDTNNNNLYFIGKADGIFYNNIPQMFL